MATKVEEAYQKYLYYHNNHPVIHSNRFDILPKSEFLHKICNDEQFYKDWGNGCLGDLPPTSKKVKYDMNVKTEPVVTELPRIMVDANKYRVVETTEPIKYLTDEEFLEGKPGYVLSPYIPITTHVIIDDEKGRTIIRQISRWALFKLHLHSIKYRICKRLGLDKNSRTT
jgi:hypothetical protein